MSIFSSIKKLAKQQKEIISIKRLAEAKISNNNHAAKLTSLLEACQKSNDYFDALSISTKSWGGYIKSFIPGNRVFEARVGCVFWTKIAKDHLRDIESIAQNIKKKKSHTIKNDLPTVYKSPINHPKPLSALQLQVRNRTAERNSTHTRCIIS